MFWLDFFSQVKIAVRKLKTHKAPDVDGIPAEVYQPGGGPLLEKIKSLFQVCWQRGEVPNDLWNAIIVSLYKNKGEKSDCSNYRGITFHCGKILAHVLLNRLIPAIAEDILPESQCVFTPTGELQIWSSYFAKFKRRAGSRTRVFTQPCRPDEGFWHHEQRRTFAYPE